MLSYFRKKGGLTLRSSKHFDLLAQVLNVCACKWVDEVIIGAPMTVTEDLVKTWDIHVVAKGAGHKRNSGEPKDDPRLWV